MTDQQRITIQVDPASQYDHAKPVVRGKTRLQALWAQKGWVAFDEMSFYLETVKLSEIACTTQPLDLRFEANNAMILTEWIIQALEIGMNTSFKTMMTACLAEDHWFPLKIDIEPDTFAITTTRDMTSHIARWIQEEFLEDYPEPKGTFMPSAFTNDCGFQTLAWIISQAWQPEGHNAMPSSEAVAWRTNFAEHLILQGHENTRVQVLPMGATSDKMLANLQTLLEQHGVSAHRSQQAAQALIQKIGEESIGQTLKAPRPWQDLKAKASQLTPPVRIVLSEELQASIERKLASGKTIGRKQNKTKQIKAQTPTQILADQVQVPNTIFQQTDGQLLSQISPSQFSPQCRGIACVNIHEAISFLQLTTPLTQEGLGLIILDHDDPRLPPQHEIIRFPATCASTGEPMLLLGALFQLGHQKVSRTAPSSAARIEEVETRCIRAMIYQDQTKLKWQDIVERPVRTLFAEGEFQATPDTIVDVWDRQYVTKNFKKSRPADADMFIVTFRVKSPAHEQILEASGQAGKYYEPRDNTGRSPDQDFRVVWMPKKSFQEVMIAKQTSVHPTWLIRSGDRLGLRTSQDHAKTIHEQHRPDVDYLSGEHMQAYRVGPLPYGTTKASLAKLYREWGWEARPGQPLGQSIGHEGVFWSSVSAVHPSHWVYSIEQGDILISPMQSNKTHQIKPASQGLVASKKTIQSMTQLPDSSTPASDPWLLSDPWSQSVSTKSLTPTQLAAIDASVAKRISEHKPPKSPDVSMDEETDARVGELEAQVLTLQHNVSQLSSNLATFQTQQQQHNGQMSQQIVTVKNQVDAQHGSLQKMLESKMDDQMSRIEALLNKRMRHNE